MNSRTAILGFRKDRIGARLIGLLNVIRLGRKFDVPSRFLWLSEADGPYPELADPRDFLDAAFVARHIDIVTTPPDLSGRTNLTALAATINEARLRRRLHAGECFHSDAAFDVTCMMGEAAAVARQQVAAIAGALPLSPRLARILDRARDRLARWGAGTHGDMAALHLRRGDLLDGDPWSRSSWPAKYVPDEFCRSWAACRPGPVIVFTDTPAATRHMAAGDPLIVPIDELLDLGDLRPAERDMAEMLLMAGCRHIGAPGGSAFSRAAAAIGRAQLASLPHDLPEDQRLADHQTLLTRVIERPDSFLCSGDLAQSAQYAGNHALTTKQGGRLAEALAGQTELAARHPFVRRIAALCALSEGHDVLAARLAQVGLDDPQMVPRDVRQCQQVLDVIAARQAPGSIGAADAFLFALFSEKAGEHAVRDQLAVLMLDADGFVARALMLPPGQARELARNAGTAVPPYWSYLADWEELLDSDGARQPLRHSPDMHRKLRLIGDDGLRADAAFAAGEAPVAPGDAMAAARIGLTASVLSLHGRYARALRLLHWLDELHPGDPLTRKRLADTCFRLGNPVLGRDFLAGALDVAGHNPLLHLSMARRLAASGHAAQALDHLERAEALWPGKRVMKRQGRRVRQALAAG